MVKIETEIEISLGSYNKLKQFIQSDVYESFLLELLDNSKNLSNRWIHINKNNQSNGQADFKSKDPKDPDAEVTLLLENNIMKKMLKNKDKSNSIKEGIENNKFISWFYEEAEETIIEALKRKNKREAIILFNIFPMQSLYSKFSVGIYAQHAADELDIFINNRIKERFDLLKNKEIFIVSYNMEGNFLLKQLYPQSGYYEFIPFYDSKNVFPLKVTRMSIIK